MILNDGGKFITWAIGRGGPSKLICPHQNHFVSPHLNYRYIKSYLFSMLQSLPIYASVRDRGCIVREDDSQKIVCASSIIFP
jgi:hypothetical protein